MSRATAPLLHRFLGMGLTILAVVFVSLRSSGVEPMPAADSTTRVIGYTLTAIVIVLLAIAFLLLRPRVPERSPRQSVDEYWSTPQVAAKAFLVWFLMEGAGVMAAVAYFLTGQPASAAVMALALVAFWLSGPNTFAK